jgi:peptidoglycan lytic transglycosylase
MRYLLPAVTVACAIFAGTAPATAKQPPRDRPKRVRSHVSLHLTRHSVVDGRGLVVRGRVRPAGAHRVKVVFHGAHGANVGATTNRNGSFALGWHPSRIGTYRVRVYAVHDRLIAASASVARHLTAYRQAAASYYGPGLYGGGLACGGTLEPGTLGVANKTLPCGTRVKLLYRGRSVTVPVVDRGPYVAGRDFDLTEATKARLGFPGLGVLLSSR